VIPIAQDCTKWLPQRLHRPSNPKLCTWLLQQMPTVQHQEVCVANLQISISTLRQERHVLHAPGGAHGQKGLTLEDQ